MLVKMRQTRLKPLGAVPSPQLPPQAGKSRQEAPIGGNRGSRGPQYYSVTGQMCNPGRLHPVNLFPLEAKPKKRPASRWTGHGG
jgi:hypothetical protein